MKVLGILAILGGLLIVVMNFPGVSGGAATSPQLIVGAVVAVIGVVLLVRQGSKKR